MEHETAYIYGLADPRDRRIRYVGHTVDCDQRYSQHMNDSASTAKTLWLSDLMTQGLQPTMVVLDVVPYDERYIEEYRWIYLGRARGWDLTNTTAMKTEKYTDIADDGSSKVFVSLDNGLTMRKLRKIVFSMDEFPKDERDKIFTRLTATITFICVALTAMILNRWNVSVDILSVLAVIAAMVSVVSFVSMAFFVFRDPGGPYQKNLERQRVVTEIDNGEVQAMVQKMFDNRARQMIDEIFDDAYHVQ